MLGDPEYGAATRTAQLPTSGASSSARLTDRAQAGESAMAGAGPNDRVRAQSTNVRNGVVTASTAGACAQCRTTDSLLGRRWRCRGMVTCGIAGAGDGESPATCHTGQLRSALTSGGLNIDGNARAAPGVDLTMDWPQLESTISEECGFASIESVVSRFESGGQLEHVPPPFEEDVRVFRFYADRSLAKVMTLGPQLMLFGATGKMSTQAGYVRLNNGQLTSGVGPIAQLVGTKSCSKASRPTTSWTRGPLSRCFRRYCCMSLTAEMPRRCGAG